MQLRRLIDAVQDLSPVIADDLEIDTAIAIHINCLESDAVGILVGSMEGSFGSRPRADKEARLEAAVAFRGDDTGIAVHRVGDLCRFQTGKEAGVVHIRHHSLLHTIGTVDAKAVFRGGGCDGWFYNGGATTGEIQGLAGQVVVVKYHDEPLTVATVNAVGPIVLAKCTVGQPRPARGPLKPDQL